MIVSTGFGKALSDPYIQQVWRRAEEELRRAQRIVFCGYSFPNADIHIKYLLKKAEVNRMGRPPAVFIVNEHDHKTDEERKIERERCLRFFRQKDQVYWTDLSFERFAGNPGAIVGYTYGRD